MIIFRQGNIFDSEAKALVNPVNTVGVMGKGLALEFKKRYPESYKNYVEVCSSGFFDVGKTILYSENGKYIINVPTKKHWKDPSKLEWIESGLKSLCNKVLFLNCSVAIPALGCGNGGLEWPEVKPLIESIMVLDTEVQVYEPSGL